MLGAIAGDIIGSVYEARPVKTTRFPLFTRSSRFTDDTVLTVATAYSILEGAPYAGSYRDFGRRFPDAGYGTNFYQWIFSEEGKPYFSFGNGSAMRVSPIGFAFDTMKEVLEEAKRSASVSHNHPEGIKGAQAVALSVFLARTGKGKEEIHSAINSKFGYNLRRTLDEIRPGYNFNETCQGTVPEAIITFLESADFEDSVRKAVSLGGDSDTLACIAGGISQAFYGKIPEEIVSRARERLPGEFLDIIDRFDEKYGVRY